MRRNGGLIRSEVFEPSATQAKGMWDIHDQYHAKLGNNWPQRKEIITFADANGVTTFTEGQSLTINIVTNGYQGGDLIYWKVVTTSTTERDIGQPIRGTVPLDSNGQATLYIDVLRDSDSNPSGEALEVHPTDSSYNLVAGNPSAYYHPVNDNGNFSQNVALTNITITAQSNTKNKGSGSHSFPSSAHPSGTSTSVSGYSWSDWGCDIFDTWGFWHFYHDTYGVGQLSTSTLAESSWSSNFDTLSVTSTLGNMTNWVTEGSDGTVNTCYLLVDFRNGTNNDSLYRIVKFRYGYVGQGAYMMDFSWAYSWAMRFCMGGNMGSDSSTVNSNQSGSYARAGSANYATLYGNYNKHNGSSCEFFATYWKPHLDADNAAFTTTLVGNDNLYFYTPNTSYGMTFWFVKNPWTSHAATISSMNDLLSQETQLT